MSVRRHVPRAALGALAAALLALPSSASAGIFPLKGYWPMNEGSGQVVRDWSGNGNNGQLGSTPGPDANDPTWIRGVLGSGLRFGGDDYVRVARSPDLEAQQLTVTLWVRGTGTPGTYRYLVGKGGDGCVSSSYALTTSYNGGLIFYIWNGDQQRSSGLLDPSAIWDGRWHNVAGTWDGRNAKLFLDGREVPGSTQYTTGIDYNLPSTGDLGFGSYLGTCDLYFAGDIDEAMVWSTALPVDTIWRTLSSLLGRPGS